MIWIFTEGEGDGIESRPPFKFFFFTSIFWPRGGRELENEICNMKLLSKKLLETRQVKGLSQEAIQWHSS